MDKINFQDLPSTETPINSDNLNLLQENVDISLKNKLDKQNVVKTLDKAGWYRVAKYNNYGENSIAFMLNVNSRYSNNNNQSATINVNLTYGKAKLTSIANLVNENTVSSIRAVSENNITYIEIYYNSNQSNPVAIDVVSQDYWGDTIVTMLDFESPTDTATLLDELVIGETTITNENGTAIKFPDGTMICKHIIIGNSFSCTARDEGRYFFYDTNNSVENVKLWTYPQKFISNDDLVVNLSVESSAYTISSLGSKYTSYVQGYCVLPYSVSQISLRWHFTAIGRWK